MDIDILKLIIYKEHDIDNLRNRATKMCDYIANQQDEIILLKEQVAKLEEVISTLSIEHL